MAATTRSMQSTMLRHKGSKASPLPPSPPTKPGRPTCSILTAFMKRRSDTYTGGSHLSCRRE